MSLNACYCLLGLDRSPFLASFRLVRLGWCWSVGFSLWIVVSELRCARVACDTAVWWGDGSVGSASKGLVALSGGSSAVIWDQDGD